jgi:hypothetical protein
VFEARADAVGVSLLFAQVEIEPAGEAAADGLVQYLQRREIRRGPHSADPADSQLGLRSARLVDDHDARDGARGWRFRLRWRRNRRGCP